MRILLSLLALSLIAPSALAQTQLIAEPVDTRVDTVQIEPLRATDSDESTSSNPPTVAPLPPPEDEVGGDGEDIGAPVADPVDEDHKNEIDILSDNTQKSDAQDGDPDQPVITGQIYNDLDEGQTLDAQVVPSQTKVLILAPSAEDDSATHDPGVAILEQLASIGIDDDDFGFVSNGKTYVRAGFVKFGDIKGESSDEASGGNAETTWKVEEGEKSKPKEIVVVGSKSTDKATPNLTQALCEGRSATCEPQGAVTPETLTDFAQRTVNTYSSVNEIRLDDAKVEIQGTQPFKLFGFIPMSLRQTVSVSIEPESFGRVKVQFAWYHIFGRKTVRSADLKTDLEQGINTAQFSKWEVAEFDATKDDPAAGPAGEEIMADETGGSTSDRPTESITFNFSEIKAQFVQVIRTAIVQYNESDLNFLSR